ncbi:RmlC-like cupin domain-containing protein [Pseudomassariella vexata]|uniref:RmlC-like cupin domain-containing protein n=1 Tax=Pseudomassariella vexata TaxID=1141098 RepID=A0A1Y2DQ50_9PEZI|nr:RmlC-like cupin domain-containing protein [Pseudomassariella vexata]ORY61380.1 RmlC-like cupin domain-containing protein [Pseudomassariella vexata]
MPTASLPLLGLCQDMTLFVMVMITALLVAIGGTEALVVQRDGGFSSGQPIDGKGGTNHELDIQKPDNLGQQSTDNGVVPNLKWSFSDSRTRILKGGWVRESVITDLPSSHDISAAQQHLTKGSIRELHWHRVAEWGYVYAGAILVSAVDENGKFQVARLEVGDIWYFPKGEAHTVQGLENENEYLLVFDDGNFDATGTTFSVDDWISHTPKHILAKNFGLDESVFETVPSPNPYITNATIDTHSVTGPNGELSGNNSYVYFAKDHPLEEVPGGGGTLRIVDSNTFPISTTIAATIVTLNPKGLRELHWHPNAEEWLYFHQGQARETVFIGDAKARTFDFRAGDTGVFPDNSGHYIENIGAEDLIWIEIYKSDRAKDVSLTQWLALTPADIVANVLKIPLETAEGLKKVKQLLVKGN